MSIDNFVNNLNWKKIGLVAIAIIVVFLIVHEILFWSIFNDSRKFMSELNSQISQQQNEIHQKLLEDGKEFEARSKKLDTLATNIDSQIEQFQTHINNVLTQVEHEREAREKAFDKAYQSAPAEMLATHKKMSEEMKKQFTQESQQRQRDFQKHLQDEHH